MTGGGRGIGAAIALRPARDGADVAVTYVRAPERAAEVVRGIEGAGGRGLAIAADAADPSAVTVAVDRTGAEFGRLDVLVDNAGSPGRPSRSTEGTRPDAQGVAGAGGAPETGVSDPGDRPAPAKVRDKWVGRGA
ncbi:SDR family NAD(P)-dependent oxidoreductase [Actinomadura graeca]|uniref:SDR family NAD(P)-dependent oxidoreductase n=1 Tax=Actinomadura graeca TaxID=2750812 RepID=UPI0023590BAC|nr:SDR family NAD(P)-dependent oxidoreductase [Actinomadura graeca]